MIRSGLFLALFLAGLLLVQPAALASERPAQDTRTNRLIQEKSPYLLLHAHNPVDWYPWGSEAFDKAQHDQKPIFLSIGYYTCHWCHVMERESYSNHEIADVLNRHFVAVKVDREERPDVDRLYLAYVQSATGSAGWPLNVFLTPDLKPFYGGTYFSPDELKALLLKIAKGWETDRQSFSDAAQRAARELLQIANEPLESKSRLQAGVLDNAFKKISAAYDPQNGGFGPPPKFPRPVILDFLLRTYTRTRDNSALNMTLETLRWMARGGIHDLLGGGFHRYTLDSQWRVPHFEKMLYDQAQLAVVYTEAWQASRDPSFQAVARDLLDFSLRELKLPGGGFASALDADSAPVAGSRQTAEGAFYVWTAQEIESVLGKKSAAIFDYAYGVERGGNIPAAVDPRRELSGENVFYEARSLDETRAKFGLTSRQAGAELAHSRALLRTARALRPQPPLDDKIVTSWNAMMISALARAGAAFQEPRYVSAAETAAEFLEANSYDAKSGLLARSFRDGKAAPDGFLDDYANFVAALLDLYQTDLQVHWLTLAAVLQGKQDALFWDGNRGGYFDESTSGSLLPARTRESYDGAEPAPNSVAAMNLLRLAQFTDHAEWRKQAEETLAAFGTRLESDPDAVPALASALDYSLARKRQILIAGTASAEDTRELLALVNKRFLPNAILLFADGAEGQKQLAKWLPFVEGAHPIAGKATAYVCENYICKLPTNDSALFARLLDSSP